MDGIVKRLKSKQRRTFLLNHSAREIVKLIGALPDTETVYKLISFSGGFASISFVKAVADFEVIDELTASTLRIGEKQFEYLATLQKAGKLVSARFFIGSLMAEDEKKQGKYNYYGKFNAVCDQNGWKRITVNNHSKIILMRTKENYYVLETSSNLNENPKIEQYSFENSKELYDFYYGFFDALEESKVIKRGESETAHSAN